MVKINKNKKAASNDRTRMKKIISLLEKEYPDAEIQLEYTNPHQLLVATILSAQCTDARVNQVTEKLFQKYKLPEDYLKVPAEELEKDIYSCGYYKAKAAHIQKSTNLIIKNYNGNVPDTMEEILKLPGVGRKTANVVLGNCYGSPGIVVDTHVMRLSNRLGFVKSKNADKIEFILEKFVPKSKWMIFVHYLIWHGRKICSSRNPKCNICTISGLCPKIGVVKLIGND